MIILVLLVVAALVYWLGGYHAEVTAWRHQRRVDGLKVRLHSTNQALDAEFDRTKRAMNEAAGQSWRNLIDRDRG